MACLHPKTLPNPRYNEAMPTSSSNLPYILVPCGHCFYCQKQKVNTKALLVKHEMSANYQVASFVTLTFAEEYVPKRNVYCDFTRDGQLLQSYDFDKTILQKFVKRVRRYIDYHKLGLRFKYIAVGEFGHLRGRCHYHLIMIGVSAQIITPIIEKCWRFGIFDVKDCDDKASFYCTKYMTKSESKLWFAPNSDNYYFNALLREIKVQKTKDVPPGQKPISSVKYQVNDMTTCRYCPLLPQMKQIILNCKRLSKQRFNNAHRVAFGWSSIGLGKSTCLQNFRQWLSLGYIPNGQKKDGTLIKSPIPRNYRNYIKDFMSNKLDSRWMKYTFTDLFPSQFSWLQDFVSNIRSEGFKTFLADNKVSYDFINFDKELALTSHPRNFIVSMFAWYNRYRTWCVERTLDTDLKSDEFYERSIRPQKYVAGFVL